MNVVFGEIWLVSLRENYQIGVSEKLITTKERELGTRFTYINMVKATPTD